MNWIGWSAIIILVMTVIIIIIEGILIAPDRMPGYRRRDKHGKR